MFYRFLIIVFLSILVFLNPLRNIAVANDYDMIELGKSFNKKWLFSYKPKSVVRGSDNNMVVFVKLKLSDEGRKAFSESFELSIKDAEEKSRAKVEDKEELFEILVSAETQYYNYYFDCVNREYKRSAIGVGAVSFLQVFKIENNTAEKRLYDILCTSNKVE